MPDPSPGKVHVNRLLTNISVGYSNPLYIADQVFPLVPVMKQSDIIPKYDQSYWFRDGAVLRGPGMPSRRGGFRVNTADTYYCPRFSYGFEIPDELRANQDQPYNMDRDGARFVTEKMQLRREVALATDFFAAGKGWTDKAGTADFAQWDDYGASAPLVDITTYRDDVEATIGREANSLLLGKQVWSQLKWHPDLIDTIKYTQRAQVSSELFASLAELSRVLIGRSIQATSAQGVAEGSATYARIWGKHALLFYRPDSPGLMEPSAGYTFVWNFVPNAIQYIKNMRNEEREVDIIEGNSYFDQKQVVAGAGVFLENAIS